MTDREYLNDFVTDWSDTNTGDIRLALNNSINHIRRFGAADHVVNRVYQIDDLINDLDDLCRQLLDSYTAAAITEAGENWLDSTKAELLKVTAQTSVMDDYYRLLLDEGLTIDDGDPLDPDRLVAA